MENVATEDIYYSTELYPSRRHPIPHARLLGNITNIFTAGSNLSDSSSFEGNRMTKVIERSTVRAQERYETLQDDVYTSTDPVHEDNTSGSRESVVTHEMLSNRKVYIVKTTVLSSLQKFCKIKPAWNIDLQIAQVT